MRCRKIAVFGGAVAVAIMALAASGPLPVTDGPPQGEPGPWQSLQVRDAVAVHMHYPDFDAAIPRAEHSKLIPETNQRDVSLGFSSGQAVRTGGRGKRPRETGDDEGEAGLFDSWLLPEAESGEESTGWGWLADSVAVEAGTSERSGEVSSRVDGRDRGENRQYRTGVDARAQARRELDLYVDDGLLDNDMGEPGYGMEPPRREAATRTENGWVSPSWR